jgi:transcriptional regulator with XRE-family HTH domain
MPNLKNLSYALIANGTGIPPDALSRIFCGKRSISESTIKRFAIFLECSKVEAYRQIEEMRATKKQQPKRRVNHEV